MKIYLVGGAVRDKLLHLPVKEHDYVVVGATPEDMLKLGYRQVGKEFPVFLHPQSGEEYALARMERKVQPGYKGFTFDTSPQVTLEEDLLRRDLTINAMAIDLETDELIDPYGGQQDIKQKILKHVSPAFSEDPVRILRVGRFLSRFYHLGFHVAPETIHLMRTMAQAGEVNALVAERVWKELERALAEKNPEMFFSVLTDASALDILFPHLSMEGPGIKALSMASSLTSDTVVRFAALLHDLPEDEPGKTQAKKTIAKLCDNYRVPNTYRELALLTALLYPKAFRAALSPVSEWVELFSSLDIYRREDRFNKFLLACSAIARVHHTDFDSIQLKNGAAIAKAVDVKILLAQGYEGRVLADALKKERTEKLALWLNKHE